MTAADGEDLAVSQARDTAALAEAHARLVEQGYTPEQARAVVDYFGATETALFAAVHARAVDRLIRLHRPEYRRLLAEERERT